LRAPGRGAEVPENAVERIISGTLQDLELRRMSVLEGAERKFSFVAAKKQSDRPVSLVIVSGVLRALDLALIGLTAVLVHSLYLTSAQAELWTHYYGATVLALFFAGTLFHWNGLYRLQGLTAGHLKLGKLAGSWSIVVLGLIVAGFLFKVSSDFSRVWLFIWFAAALGAMAATRGALCLAGRRWVAQGRLTRNVAIVGGGEHGDRLISALGKAGDEGLNVIGFFDDRNDRCATQLGGIPKVGTVDDLITYARYNRVDQIIVALPWAAEQRVLQIFRKLRSLPVDIRLAPDLVGFRLSHSGYSHVGGVPVLNVFQKPITDWHAVIKAVEDRVLAALLLLFLAPLFLVVAAAIKLDSRGPVFFRQKRYGFNNHLIGVFKFRSMRHDMRDEKAEKLVTKNDPRVTRVGAFLRKTSIDELPQLINVLLGEMSIVGPRPHALSAKAADRLYEEVVAEYAARHRVKPGITGWAQVKGWRGETDTVEKIQKRVEHDLYYIENWSLGFDLRILILTFFAVLKPENAY
jgi:Undecaprenyl-phosphate glucose phosphotransferase